MCLYETGPSQGNNCTVLRAGFLNKHYNILYYIQSISHFARRNYPGHYSDNVLDNFLILMVTTIV